LIIGKSYPAARHATAVRSAARSTLHYAGTLAQRRAQWRWDHPAIERQEAAVERDTAILRANTELTGHERRQAIVAAWGRYIERRH